MSKVLGTGSSNIQAASPVSESKASSCCLTLLMRKIWEQFKYLIEKLFYCFSKKPIAPSITQASATQKKSLQFPNQVKQAPSKTDSSGCFGIKEEEPLIQELFSSDATHGSEETVEIENPVKEETRDVEQGSKSEILEKEESIPSLKEPSLSEENPLTPLPNSNNVTDSAPASVSLPTYTIKSNGEIWSIRDEESLAEILNKQLKPLVYGVHREIVIEIPHGEKSDELALIEKKLRSFLEENFHVIDQYSGKLRLSPKIKNQTEKGNIKIIDFKDGSMLMITGYGLTTLQAMRTFANGDTEKGEFVKVVMHPTLYTCVKGKRTTMEGTIYLFPLSTQIETSETVQWVHAVIEGEHGDFRVINQSAVALECVQEKRSYPFLAYNIEVLEQKKSIATLEQQDMLLAELKAHVNLSHRELRLRWPEEMSSNERLKAGFTLVLKEQFAVDTDAFGVTLRPKVADGWPQIEGKKITTRFESGVVSTFEKIKNRKGESYFRGERTFPGSIIETGKFRNKGLHPFFRGVLKVGDKTFYVLPKGEFGNSPWTFARVPDESGTLHWQVLRKEPKDLAYNGIKYVIDSSKRPVELVLEHLEEDRGNVLMRLYKKKALSLEDMQIIVPKLFQPSAQDQAAPIFNFSFHATQLMLELAKEHDIPVDVRVAHQNNKGKNEPFFMHWVEEIKKSKTLSVLFSLDPTLLAQEGERIFTKLVRSKNPLAATFDFSSCTFDPKNSFIRDLLAHKKCSKGMPEQFKGYSLQEQSAIVKIANRYKKLHFLESIETFKERPWEPKMDAIKPIDGNPIVRSPDFVSPEMAIKQREESMHNVLKAMRQQGLLLSSEEFDGDPSKYEETRDDIGSIVGRNYLQEIITKLNLDQIKLPQQIAVLKEGKTSIALTLQSNGTIYDTNVVVYTEKIPKSKKDKSASFAQIEQLITLLEAAGYDDTLAPGSNRKTYLGVNVVVAKDGLYLKDTGYENFQRQPNYSLLNVLKKFLPEADEPKLVQMINDKRESYKAIQEQMKEAAKQSREIEKVCNKFYGKEHRFTFTLADLTA